jgi:hypothetical protein
MSEQGVTTSERHHNIPLIEILEQLAGQPAPIVNTAPLEATRLLQDGGGLGYTQFNELLLLFGFDRVSASFFQYLVDGSLTYETGSAIESLERLRNGVDRFRRLSLLHFGNVKFGFKSLSRDPGVLTSHVEATLPTAEDSFLRRHNAIQPIEPIPPEETYLLGYLVGSEIDDRLRKNPNDVESVRLREQRVRVLEVGRRNHTAYLASDHLDVYVATSMRQRHEYVMVNEVCNDVFNDDEVKDLKLRWFDPTQAYCPNRIDKGLAEALMLRRAKCTLYLVQESDTLGKDSELASTLAQGKTVIAFVPSITDERIQRQLNACDTPEKVLQHLKIFDPLAAWNNDRVTAWVAKPAAGNLAEMRDLLRSTIERHYDKRAKTLKEEHPLGIQVNLTSGVANGVLVVRSTKQCAQLIRRIVTFNLEFDLRTETFDGLSYVTLREKISGSIYRVMTGDAMLTNAFWNFYKEPA